MTIDVHCSFFRDFRSGDLIYGTELDRRLYYDIAELIATKYTIDSVTREMDQSLRGFGDFANEHVSVDQLSRLPQSAQFFLSYSKKTVFWSKMTGRRFSSDYTKQGVAKGMPDLGDRIKWSQAYFRAKCKAGIGFVIDSGFTVRFVLDSLYTADSMHTIARKESAQPWHTGSELRYLYRQRNHPATANQVVFYVDGEPVPAPWVNFPDAWAHYGDTRMDLIPEHARKD